MKPFDEVQIGDPTIDYNEEVGTVVAKAKQGDPAFKKMTMDFADLLVECGEEGLEAIEVHGDDYGHFGGEGVVSFLYGYDGAYVPVQ